MVTSIVFRTMTPKADWLGCTFNVIPLSGDHPVIVFHFATSKLDLLANTYMNDSRVHWLECTQSNLLGWGCKSANGRALNSLWLYDKDAAGCVNGIARRNVKSNLNLKSPRNRTTNIELWPSSLLRWVAFYILGGVAGSHCAPSEEYIEAVSIEFASRDQF